MRVVIAGAGNVGTFIANDLVQSGHTVVVLEQDPAKVARRIAEDTGVEWRVADACEFTELEAADLRNADVVVAATGDDEDNLVVSLLARQEFGVPRIIARINHPENQWLFNENWGVDVSVSTPHLITALVEEAVNVGSLVRLFQLEHGHVEVVEITLDADSPVVGKALKDLSVPRDSTIIAVIRDQHVVVPRGDTTFHENDEVLALVAPESIAALRTLLE